MTRPHLDDIALERASIWVRAGNALLGIERRRRADLGGYLLSCAVYLVSIFLLLWFGREGYINEALARRMALGMAASVALFYIILRFDRSHQISIFSVVVCQMVLAFTWIAMAYSVTGESRGVTLMIMTLVQVFGMFYLRMRAQRWVAAYAFAAMSGVMLFTVLNSAHPQAWKLEFPYFLTMATSLLSTLLLGVRLSAMRDRLKVQKAELRVALGQLMHMASHDDLTGLLNRRQMLEILDRQMKEFARDQIPFCLAMVDLDHFKRINDTLGHNTGDEVLQNFAQQARLFMRESDSLARWGGEEFLVLFAHTNLDAAQLGLQRLQERLRVVTICPRLSQLQLTFSAGLVQARADERLEQMIERADHALYAAKEGGRARTTVHG